MKILVTGGLGFIGSNFITMLLNQNKNFEIVNIDAELVGSNHDNLAKISHLSSYEFIKGNITNRNLMENTIDNCDAVC